MSKTTTGFPYETTLSVSETPTNAAAPAPNAEMINVLSGYEALGAILALALDQAQNGKGNERHQVGGASFTEQPICELTRFYGLAYPFGQAAKKTHEVGQLKSTKAKQAEILGAINYLAAAYIVVSEDSNHNM